MTRTVVVGDVHGCAAELHELLDRCKVAQPGTRVIMLGDLMDKGPYPLECLQVVMNYGFEAVLSNHEERHVRWWRREKARRETGTTNNMKPWHDDRDRRTNEALTAEQIEWMASLPPWLEVVSGWVAVHGGLQPGRALAEQDVSKIIRLRYVNADGEHVPIDYDAEGPRQPPGTKHWTELWEGPENVVYGHEAFSLSQPRLTMRAVGRRLVTTLGIDTGCVHGGHLSALVFDEHGRPELVKVKARQCYLEPTNPIPSI